MRLAVVGTGYVGLVSAVCFAELGHDVVGVDIDEQKVAQLCEGRCPIYEPEVEDLLRRNMQSGRLRFTTDAAAAIDGATVVFSAVATPSNEDGSADLRAVLAVAKTVAQHATGDLVYVNKSTVPVGTGAHCEQLIRETLAARNAQHHIAVVSNPEFLREGHAVHDTMQPDRIIVGVNGDAAATQSMEELYHPLTRTRKPLVWMSRESAEMVKYASNAFLASKISFINMLSQLCEQTGASVRDVARGMGMDDRIGPRFLHAGIGYGGSCFPKDVRALLAIGQVFNVPLPLVQATHEVNMRQRERRIMHILSSLAPASTVAVWGLSFKPRTDDIRESPGLDVVRRLSAAGHAVRVYDPVAMQNAQVVLGEDAATWCESALEAATDADATVLVTEWDVFRGMDLRMLAQTMRGTLLFDERNVYEPSDAAAAGLLYHGIGV